MSVTMSMQASDQLLNEKHQILISTNMILNINVGIANNTFQKEML